MRKPLYARLEFVDTATGRRVRPLYPPRAEGVAPTGRWVTNVGRSTVVVDEQDLAGSAIGEHPRLQRWLVDSSEVDYAERAKAEAAERRAARRPRKPATFRETFDDPRDAASSFMRENELFFDHVRDPVDGLREWMDRVEVRSGKGSAKLSRTAAGRRILAARPPDNPTAAALRWVFGQAKGRRWDAVDWRSIDALGEALEPFFEPLSEAEAATPGLYWRPVFGGFSVQQLEELDDASREALALTEGAREVAEAVEELRRAYDANQACVPLDQQAIVERRIAEWSTWASRPNLIPAYACEPDERTGGYTCDYPSVAAELRRIRSACSAGYDADWSTPLSRAGALGYPDTSEGPEDPLASDELAAAVGEAIGGGGFVQLSENGRAYGAPAERIVGRREIDGVIYQLELVKCGSRNKRTGVTWCWCMRAPANQGHGPFWYAYFLENGTRLSKYIGVRFVTLEEKRRQPKRQRKPASSSS